MKKLQKLLFYGIYGTLGSSMIILFLKESFRHLDFRTIQQFNLYREDSFFEETTNPTCKFEKLVEALEKNPNLTEEQVLLLLELKEAILENPYIDYADLYQRYRTSKIQVVDTGIQSSNGYQMRASYSYTDNIYTIYQNTGGKMSDLKHENGHTILGSLSDYIYLNEGITELYVCEYCNYGIPSFYFTNVNCARILCELMDSDILIKALSTDDSSYILDALKDISQDEELSKLLLDTMENYCEKELISYPSQEDKDKLKDVIVLFLSKVHSLDSSTIEQIHFYFNQIFIPSIDKREELIFYFNKESFQLEENYQKIYK